MKGFFAGRVIPGGLATVGVGMLALLMAACGQAEAPLEPAEPPPATTETGTMER